MEILEFDILLFSYFQFIMKFLPILHQDLRFIHFFHLIFHLYYNSLLALYSAPITHLAQKSWDNISKAISHFLINLSCQGFVFK